MTSYRSQAMQRLSAGGAFRSAAMQRLAARRSVAPSLLPEGEHAAAEATLAGTRPEQLYQTTYDELVRAHGAGNVYAPGQSIPAERFAKPGHVRKSRLGLTYFEDPTTGEVIADKPVPGNALMAFDRAGKLVTVEPDRAMRSVEARMQANLETEAAAQPSESWSSRAEAGVKMTDAGVLNNLRARYPGATVIPTRNEFGVETGQVLIKEPGKPARYLDKPGPEWRDLADLSGEAIEMGPAIAGGVTAGPVGAGVGAAAGNVARQGASAALPGDDELSVRERIALPVLSGALGYGGEAVGPVIARGVYRATAPLRPIRTGLGALVRRETVPETAEQTVRGGGSRVATLAREGADLADATGVPLGADQMSGSRTLRKIGGALRQSPDTADDMFAVDLDRTKKLSAGVREVIEKSSGPEVSANDATRRVAVTRRKQLAQLNTKRAQQASSDFGAVDQAAGGKPVMDVSGTLATIDRLIAENEGRASVIGGLQAMRNGLLAEGAEAATTARRFQNKLSDWGEKATFAKNRKAKRIYAVVADAMKADLDKAAADGPVGELLRKARGNYRAMSQEIEASRNELLDAVLKLDAKGKPEKMVDKLLSPSYGDEQVKKAIGMLSAVDPEAASQLRRAALDAIVAKSAPKTGSGMATHGAEMSPAKFASLHQKLGTRIDALFADDPAALAGWKKLAAAAQRLADTAGTGEGGSQTAAMQWFGRLMTPGAGGVGGGTIGYLMSGGDMGTAAKGAVVGSLAMGLRRLAGRLTSRRLMRILNDREQTDLLLGLVEPKPGTTTTQLARRATQLLMLSERDVALEGDD